MRIMAIDVGDKTIGVALTDPLGLIAQGHSTIQRTGIRKDCGKIMDIAKETDCHIIVIGLPINLDGSDSVQTQKVREFKNMLENKMKSSSMSKIRTVFQDERFTTLQADKVLRESSMKRKKRKEVVDKQAAILILQGYMDSQI